MGTHLQILLQARAVQPGTVAREGVQDFEFRTASRRPTLSNGTGDRLPEPQVQVLCSTLQELCFQCLVPRAGAVAKFRRGRAAAQQPTTDPRVVHADGGIKEADSADYLSIPVDGDGNTTEMGREGRGVAGAFGNRGGGGFGE